MPPLPPSTGTRRNSTLPFCKGRVIPKYGTRSEAHNRNVEPWSQGPGGLWDGFGGRQGGLANG